MRFGVIWPRKIPLQRLSRQAKFRIFSKSHVSVGFLGSWKIFHPPEGTKEEKFSNRINERRTEQMGNCDDEPRVNLGVEVNPNNIGWQHKIIFSQRNLAKLLVDWNASIVERRWFENDAKCATNTWEREHPEEEAIKHHRDELPVLDNLKRARKRKSDQLLSQSGETKK